MYVPPKLTPLGRICLSNRPKAPGRCASAPFATRFFMQPFAVADNSTKNKKSAKATSQETAQNKHTQSQLNFPTSRLHIHAIKRTSHVYTRIHTFICIHIRIHSCLAWGTANREPAASSADNVASRYAILSSFPMTVLSRAAAVVYRVTGIPLCPTY